MDPIAATAAAYNANATVLGAANASEIYRLEFDALIKTDVLLTDEQKSDLRASVSFPCEAIGRYSVTNDHPLNVAYRDITRKVYDKTYQLLHTKLPTLVIGSTFREIKTYQHNPNIDYYYHGSDSQDVSRMLTKVLESLLKTLSSKVSTKDRRAYIQDDTKVPNTTLRYNSVKQILNDYKQLNKMPSFIKQDFYGNYYRLVFEDTIYNFSADMLLNIFKTTGAYEAVGYAFLPLELIFPDKPESRIYRITQKNEETILTYRDGYNNGYIHKTSNLKTLFKNFVIVGDEFSLVTQIDAYVGPMATFRIVRTNTKEKIVREIGLPRMWQYVKVLNLRESANFRTGKVRKPLKYISMVAHEFYAVFNYLNVIAENSVTLEQTGTFIRHRMDGASLATKQLIAPWYLDEADLTEVALTIFVYWKISREYTNRILQNAEIGSFAEKLKTMFLSPFRPIKEIIDWIFSGHLVDSLIIKPDQSVLQIEEIPEYTNSGPEIAVSLPLKFVPDEKVKTKCWLCSCFKINKHKMGTQKFINKHPLSNKHNFIMTKSDLDAMFTRLITNDMDPEGLKRVKDRASKAMPRGKFEHEAEIFVIQGSAGVGKSWIIRACAKKSDLIFAPFSKLKSDYMSVEDDDGHIFDFNFKTNHRAMETTGAETIWVDEYTNIDYEFLACVAKLNGARRIVLVGDFKQTHLQSTEGLAIKKRMNIDEFPNHRPVMFYRGKRDVAALMNKLFDCGVVPVSKEQRSIYFLEPKAGDSESDIIRMQFGKMTAAVMEQEINTVRSNQGGTMDVVQLDITESDKTLIGLPELVLVAMTRHKSALYINPDGNPVAQSFIDGLKMEGFYDENHPNYLENYIPNLEDMDFEDEEEPTELEAELILQYHEKQQTDLLDYKRKVEKKMEDYRNYYKQKSIELGVDKVKKFCTLCDKPGLTLCLDCSIFPEELFPLIKNINVQHKRALNFSLKMEKTQTKPKNMYNFKSAFEKKTILYHLIKTPVEDHLIEKVFISLEYAKNKKTVDSLVCTNNVLVKIYYETMKIFDMLLENDNFKNNYLYKIAILEQNVKDNNKSFSNNPESFKDSKNEIKTRLPQDFKEKPTVNKIIPIEKHDHQCKSDCKQCAKVICDDIGCKNCNFVKFLQIKEHKQKYHYHCQCNKNLTVICCKDIKNCDPDDTYPDYNKHVCIKEKHERIAVPKHNICLLIALGKILNRSLESIWQVFTDNFDTDFLKERFSSNDVCMSTQFSNLDLKFFCEDQKLKFRVIPLGPNAVRQWGTTTCDYGPTENEVCYFITWVPGHWDVYDIKFSKEKPRVLTGGYKPLYDVNLDYHPTNKTIPNGTVDQGFLDQSMYLQGFDYHTYTVSEPKHKPIIEKQPFLQSPFNSHELYDDVINRTAFMGYTSLNMFGVKAIPDNFSNGRINFDILTPFNQRGNVANLKREFYVASSADGLHYNVNDPFQELQCLQNRYLKYKKKLPLTRLGMLLAEEMALLFRKECLKNELPRFETSELYDIFDKFIDAAKTKHYPAQRRGFDNPFARLIYFMMKNIMKPSKHKAIDIWKAGQGIAAWDKDAQILFGAIMRAINRHFLNSLKPNVIFNNGYSEQELLTVVNAQLNKLNKLSLDGVVDADEFDAHQNEFTQYLERCVLKQLNISDIVIELYYSFRQNYKLATKYVYANGGMTKTSGEPATLLFNSILSAVITNYVLRGDGPFAMIIQGDDCTKKQLNLKLNEENYTKLKQFVDMSLKISVGKGIEFCGYIIEKGKMIPCLLRKLKKVTGHRFRDYKHFTEYQQSIRNTLKLIYEQGLESIIYHNASNLKISFAAAEDLFHQYQSFAHIDEKQFLKTFKKIVVTPIIPTIGDYCSY